MNRRVRRRAWPATLVAVALLLVACADQDAGRVVGGSPPSAGRNALDPTSGSADPSGQTGHTVDPPGALTTRLVGDDMLVVGTDTLPDRLIRRIKAVRVDGTKAVDAIEVMSIGQISAENEVYDVAAVDLAGYRQFTPPTTANFQDQWDRLAGGEFAADQELEGDLPLDADGYLAAGSGEESQLIHAGAYAPQAGGLDIVVNTAWGRALGLPEGNALLISTGSVSPQAAKRPLRRVLGEDYSVSDLDIVAEAGLDPEAAQVVLPVGTFSDAVGTFRYRPIGGGRIAPDPAWVSTHIVAEQVPILGTVRCNTYMMPQLKAALREVVEAGLADEIHPDEYAGCYYPRFIAGSKNLSNHAFGLALDINVPGNQRGTAGEIDREVVAIFKKWGFAWGGDWRYTDPMHFELARIVNPG